LPAQRENQDCRESSASCSGGLSIEPYLKTSGSTGLHVCVRLKKGYPFEQTVVPPYVVRPVEAASVSMPLSWDEREGDLRVGDFTLANAPARIERTGDLFRTAFDSPQDLAVGIAALEKHLHS
jgi:DNA primase